MQSNTKLANIIFNMISFRIGKLIFLVNLLVYFLLLSRWKSIAKMILYTINPVSTVNAEFKR